MGLYPGTCEIVESNEELDSVQRSKGTNSTSSGLGMDEKVGKLPMLRTGHKFSVEDDLNQLFEAIDRRTLARGSGLSPQLGAGSSSKGALKKPIRVGVSQAPGIGISESLTLKQALRGLCISHASEMATMKRSKPVGLPRVSEAGAIKSLYRAVVVNAKESGLPLDEGNGGVVEISPVAEKSTSKLSGMPESLEVPRTKSSNPSAQTSPLSAVATTTKVTATKTPPQDGIFPKSTEIGGKTKTLKLEQKGKLNYAPSLPSSNTIKKILELDEFVDTSAEVGSKASMLELVHKGEQYAASKVSKSAGNSPRLVKPFVRQKNFVKKKVRQDVTSASDNCNTCNEVRNSDLVTTNVNYAPSLSSSNTIKNVVKLDEIVDAIKEVGSKTSMVRKGNKYIANEVSKSAGNSPRLVKPAFRHKSFVKKKVKQDPTSASNSSNTCNEVCDDDLVPSTGKLVCRTPNSNQKNIRKESASPSSGSTCLSIEVSSSYVDSGTIKRGLSSNSCDDTTFGTTVSEKSRSREKGNFSQSSKSSIGEYSSSTSISEESNLSGSHCSGNRPHMSKDLRWDAIRHVELRHGSLGLRNFNLLKRLGCGDIGTVYLAELTGTNCPFALKVMDSEFLASRKKMPRARTEREILQMLDHPFLPTLYAHFTTDKFSCLVMEYCPGGDLHVLRQRQPSRCFSEQAARFYVAEVLLALEYLHMLGVVYRDLKPENILVREDGHIMLSDFDLSLRCSVSPTLLQSSSSIMETTKKPSGPCTDSSCIDPFCLQPSWVQVSCFSPRLIPTSAKTRRLKPDLATQVSPLPQLVAEPTSARSNSFVGTHEYLAPEIIKGEGHGSAVDWWTFGIFLYELIFGKTPFKGSGNEDTLANVVSQSLKFPENPLVSFQARDLIRGLLIKEPENRLGSVKGATEIKQHPFFEGLNWALIRCAVPPEMPKCCDPGVMAVACQKKESKCLELRTTSEHLEFELF